MSREKFEQSELFKYYSEHSKFIEFDGDKYKFNELSKRESQMQLACMTVSLISINAAWSVWQEQQKVIDELESRVTDLRKNLKDRELAVFARQERIDKLESQLRGHKIALDIFNQNERCRHFSTTMFHGGKAECFQCNAIVNENHEVIDQQSKGLFNKDSEP